MFRALERFVQPDSVAIYDQLLAVRCRLGDAAAMEELIRRWEPRLLYFLRRLTENEADAFDVLQQTWMKVMRSIDQLRDPAAVGPWLYRIARRTALNHARTAMAYRKAMHDLATETAPPPGANGQHAFEDAEAVHWGLSRISLPHREVLTLFLLEDMPQDQIAAVLDVPVGTVKSRLHHAKASLRAVLDEGGRP